MQRGKILANWRSLNKLFLPLPPIFMVIIGLLFWFVVASFEISWVSATNHYGLIFKNVIIGLASRVYTNWTVKTVVLTSSRIPFVFATKPNKIWVLANSWLNITHNVHWSAFNGLNKIFTTCAYYITHSLIHSIHSCGQGFICKEWTHTDEPIHPQSAVSFGFSFILVILENPRINLEMIGVACAHFSHVKNMHHICSSHVK